MRVVFIDNVCDPSYPGTSGHSEMIWGMAEHLVKMGTEVHIVAPYAVNSCPNRQIIVHQFKLPWFQQRNAIARAYVAWLATITARHIAASIIHTTDAFSAGIAVKTVDRPVVFTVSGSIYQREHSAVRLDPMATVAYKVVSRMAARHATRIVATSSDMKYWWEYAGATSDRIIQIPLGVNTEMFNPGPYTDKSLQLSSTGHVLLVSRLAPENNIDLALKAAAELCCQIPDLRLDIIGDGPESAKLQQLSLHLGLQRVVNWRGSLAYTQLPDAYRSARILLFSRCGGAPARVVLQALASGLPVVAFKAAGNDDYVVDGQTGLLVTAGDVIELAEAMRLLLSDQAMRSAMSEAAWTHVQQRFTWSKVIEQLRRDVYEPIYKGKYYSP